MASSRESETAGAAVDPREWLYRRVPDIWYDKVDHRVTRGAFQNYRNHGIKHTAFSAYVVSKVDDPRRLVRTGDRLAKFPVEVALSKGQTVFYAPEDPDDARAPEAHVHVDGDKPGGTRRALAEACEWVITQPAPE